MNDDEKSEILEEFYPPSYVSAKTGLGLENLKKYARLFERYSGRKELYERDSRNARKYTGTDLEALQYVITLKTEKGITVENAVIEAVKRYYPTKNHGIITPPVTDEKSGIMRYDDYEKLVSVIARQQDQIDQLIENSERQTEKIDSLLAEIEKSPRKGFWSKLFKK